MDASEALEPDPAGVGDAAVTAWGFLQCFCSSDGEPLQSTCGTDGDLLTFAQVAPQQCCPRGQTSTGLPHRESRLANLDRWAAVQCAEHALGADGTGSGPGRLPRDFDASAEVLPAGQAGIVELRCGPAVGAVAVLGHTRGVWRAPAGTCAIQVNVPAS